jgi:hypothetical protein
MSKFSSFLSSMTWVHWATFLAVIVFIWLPENVALFTASLLLPLVGLILYVTGRKRTPPTEPKTVDSKGWRIGRLDYLFISGTFMAIATLNIYFVLDYKKILLPFALLTGVMVTAVLYVRKRQSSDAAPRETSNFIIIGNIVVYCFGAVVGINSMYDFSPPEIVDVTVGSKAYVKKWYDDAGEGAHVIKTVLPGKQDSTTIEIPFALYLKVKRGDVLSIRHHTGLLRIPWYRVEKATGP